MSRASACAPMKKFPIPRKRLRRKERGLAWQIDKTDAGGRHEVIQFLDACISRRKFAEDNGIDVERPDGCGLLDCRQGPIEPIRIVGGEVEQYVGIDERQSSPRISFITSSVVIPGPA
jgi:hypothetical protein